MARPSARRDHQVEDDDHAAHHHDGHRVPDAPQASDQGGTPGAPLPAHDRGYGDHVVGIRRMSHAEEETQHDHGQAGNAGRSLSAPSWGLGSHGMSRPYLRQVDALIGASNRQQECTIEAGSRPVEPGRTRPSLPKGAHRERSLRRRPRARVGRPVRREHAAGQAPPRRHRPLAAGRTPLSGLRHRTLPRPDGSAGSAVGAPSAKRRSEAGSGSGSGSRSSSAGSPRPAS